MTFYSLLLALLLSSCSSSETPKNPQAKVDALTATPPPRELAYQAPDNWNVTKRASSIQYRTFLVKDGEAEVSIVFRPGNAGSDLHNINRWRQQIMLGRLSKSELHTASRSMNTQLGKARTVDFSSDDERLIGAILPIKEGTWFIKMKGNAEVIRQEQPRLAEFLNALHER